MLTPEEYETARSVSRLPLSAQWDKAFLLEVFGDPAMVLTRIYRLGDAIGIAVCENDDDSRRAKRLHEDYIVRQFEFLGMYDDCFYNASEFSQPSDIFAFS